MLFGVSVSVVIPALNEAESLPHVLARIPAGVHEVILVDGASTDGTMEVARRIRPDIRLVTQERRGKGAALRAGFEAATGDIVVHLDADGSTDPAEIPAFVGALLGGADYAKGSRFMQGGKTDDITVLRMLGNKSFVTLANLLFGSHFSDITYGYNAVWRRHHHLLAPEIDGWAHEIVANIRAHRRGLRVAEIASREAPRIAGEAKLRTFSAGWTILKAIVGEWLRPLPVTAATAFPAHAVAAYPSAEAYQPAAAEAPHFSGVPVMVDRRRAAIPVAVDRRRAVPSYVYSSYASEMASEADRVLSAG
jgi:glycosyltransferase involved in cell wall biosynthesis